MGALTTQEPFNRTAGGVGQGGDILRGIALDEDEIREFSGLKGSELVLDAEEARIGEGCGEDGIHGTEAAFGEQLGYDRVGVENRL